MTALQADGARVEQHAAGVVAQGDHGLARRTAEAVDAQQCAKTAVVRDAGEHDRIAELGLGDDGDLHTPPVAVAGRVMYTKVQRRVVDEALRYIDEDAAVARGRREGKGARREGRNGGVAEGQGPGVTVVRDELALPARAERAGGTDGDRYEEPHLIRVHGGLIVVTRREHHARRATDVDLHIDRAGRMRRRKDNEIAGAVIEDRGVH